jgi:hypothetical protein
MFNDNMKDWLGILLRVIGYIGGFLLVLFVIKYIIKLVI